MTPIFVNRMWLWLNPFYQMQTEYCWEKSPHKKRLQHKGQRPISCSLLHQSAQVVNSWKYFLMAELTNPDSITNRKVLEHFYFFSHWPSPVSPVHDRNLLSSYPKRTSKPTKAFIFLTTNVILRTWAFHASRPQIPIKPAQVFSWPRRSSYSHGCSSLLAQNTFQARKYFNLVIWL